AVRLAGGIRAGGARAGMSHPPDMCVCVRVLLLLCGQPVSAHTCAHTRTHAHPHTHTHTNTHKHTHTHTATYSQMHTLTPPPPPPTKDVRWSLSARTRVV